MQTVAIDYHTGFATPNNWTYVYASCRHIAVLMLENWSFKLATYDNLFNSLTHDYCAASNLHRLTIWNCQPTINYCILYFVWSPTNSCELHDYVICITVQVKYLHHHTCTDATDRYTSVAFLCQYLETLLLTLASFQSMAWLDLWAWTAMPLLRSPS